jgi:hypothetical protein
MTTNLPQSQATYFDTDFIQNLKALTPYYRCVERRELPPQHGVNHRLYMYQAGFGLAFNIAQSSEGTVGSGIAPAVNTESAVIGQYSDFVNVSDYAMETTIDPCLENLEKEMCYRLAGSISTLIKNVWDASNTIDNSVSQPQSGTNVLVRSVLTSLEQELRHRSVLPFTDNKFLGIVDPLGIGDVLNDTSVNGLLDVYKHTNEGLDRFLEMPGSNGEDEVVPVLDFGGMRFYESPLVTQTSNFNASGRTGYRTYLTGHQGIIGISLGVKENSQLGEGDWHNMKIWIMKPEGPDKADPARVIGGWTSYNVKMVFTTPPDTTMRLRYTDAVSGLS